MTVPPPAPTDSAGPPPSVRNAFRLSLVDVGLRVLGVLVAVVLAPRILRAVGGPTAATLSPFTVRAILLGVALVLVAIELAVVFRMRAGRQWARVVLIGLGVVELAVVIVDSNSWGSTFSSGPLGAISVLVRIVGFAVLLVAVSLLVRPEAARYFRGVRG